MFLFRLFSYRIGRWVVAKRLPSTTFRQLLNSCAGLEKYFDEVKRNSVPVLYANFGRIYRFFVKGEVLHSVSGCKVELNL
jgi:hypothetical protein